MEWTKTEDAKPVCQQTVFVTVASKDIDGQRYTTTAMYIPPKTIFAADFLDDDGTEDLEDYDEEKDIGYVIEGWFETLTAAGEMRFIDDIVTHWMEQPPLPEKG